MHPNLLDHLLLFTQAPFLVSPAFKPFLPSPVNLHSPSARAADPSTRHSIICATSSACTSHLTSYPTSASSSKESPAHLLPTSQVTLYWNALLISVVPNPASIHSSVPWCLKSLFQSSIQKCMFLSAEYWGGGGTYGILEEWDRKGQLWSISLEQRASRTCFLIPEWVMPMHTALIPSHLRCR